MAKWEKLGTVMILVFLVALPFALVPVLSPRDRAVALDEPKLSSGERWTAVAPGKIEPRTGEYRLSAVALGRIAEVAVQAGDTVSRGDLLLRLDDQELLARTAAASADVTLKKFARDEQAASTRVKQRYDADDAAFSAEQRQISARSALDRAVAARRHGGSEAEVTAVRTQLQNAEADVGRARAAAAEIRSKQGAPDPNVHETELSMARSQLAAWQTMLEQTRVRAPIDGAVLSTSGKAGEIAAPSSPEPLMVLGDVSKLRIRAEVDGRDLSKVHTGQRAVVRVDAFADGRFSGHVTSIAPGLSPGKLSPRGPRRTGELEVLEVMIALDGQPPLLPGLKVDVYFVDE
jgi:HlyD family secretion protein